MTGGVYRLKVKGPQDIFLTGNPQYNFINQVFMRHYNFSSETFSLPFDNGDGDYSKKLEINIPRKGDYLRKAYLHLTLDKLTRTSGTYAGWTNSLGYAIIDYVDFIAGGVLVDRRYGLQMHIENELKGSSGINSAEGLLTGTYSHIESLERNGDSQTNYIIPMNFWFCENIGSALPISRLNYQSLKIVIKLRSFEECVVYDGVSQPTGGTIKSAKFLAEYLYTDSIQTSDSYLINQVQAVNGEQINGGFYKTELPFNHPVSEIVFALRSLESEENNDWFNFSIRNINIATPIKNILKSAKLFADNTLIMEDTDEFTLRVLNGLRYRKYATNKHIYTIPFADDLTKWFPNGTLNFSCITSPKIVVELVEEAVLPVNIFIFAKNFNIININNGMLSLNYS